MSGFSSIALPGGIPVSGGGRSITPESLFSSEKERNEYRRLIMRGSPEGKLKVKRVKVRIFDLSDEEQVEEYEKLWAEVLEKVSTGDMVVDHHSDLVHRKDGTSYWMKYVEYVEFGDADEDCGKEKIRRDRNGTDREEVDVA